MLDRMDGAKYTDQLWSTSSALWKEVRVKVQKASAGEAKE